MAQETKKKKNRLRYMILSVILAVLAWVAVTYINDPDITKKLPGIRVEFTGEDTLADRGLVVTNRSYIPRVSVKLRGNRSDIIKAMDKVKVIVDLSVIDEKGEYEIEGSVKLPNSRVTAEKVNIQTIPVSVASLETKDIPVKVLQTGELSGKTVRSVPETETVAIKGAKHELDLIRWAEVSVDISNITDGAKTELGYTLVLEDGTDREALTTLQITENVIGVNNIIYTAKEMPVRIVLKDTDRELDTEKTTIEPGAVWVGIDEEQTKTEYLTVTIDSKAGEGEYKVDKAEDVYIPDYSKKVKVKPVWRE